MGADFLRFISFVFLFPFPRSRYAYTALARQPKIFALNSFAPASVFRRKRKQRIKVDIFYPDSVFVYFIELLSAVLSQKRKSAFGSGFSSLCQLYISFYVSFY